MSITRDQEAARLLCKLKGYHEDTQQAHDEAGTEDALTEWRCAYCGQNTHNIRDFFDRRFRAPYSAFGWRWPVT